MTLTDREAQARRVAHEAVAICYGVASLHSALCDAVTAALLAVMEERDAAAQSLETIASWKADRVNDRRSDDYAAAFWDIRAYARNRARVARGAFAASAAPEAKGATDGD